MHIDLNSCFATIEQQANPFLRGKPIAVAAYTSPRGCILAPSIEAKRFGIKTGMQVQEGKMLYPDLIVLEPDPWKYRTVHIQLRKLLARYTNVLEPKSIDEFVLDLEGFPAQKIGIINTAIEVKKRIKSEIGEWLTVSIGIAPNRLLAKTAAGLKKPDGLDEINVNNFSGIFAKLDLTDLCGIANNNAVRLNKVGIHTVTDFYNAPAEVLQRAFQSIVGYRWFLRLRGWEVDDIDFGRKSFGNSFAIKEQPSKIEQITPILQKLVQKSTIRMRRAGYKTQHVHVSILYNNGFHWHMGRKTAEPLFNIEDIYKAAYKILRKSPYSYPIHTLAVSCCMLTQKAEVQLGIFDNSSKKENLAQAIDLVTGRWGDFIITPARMLSAKEKVLDRISFGGVKELVLG